MGKLETLILVFVSLLLIGIVLVDIPSGDLNNIEEEYPFIEWGERQMTVFYPSELDSMMPLHPVKGWILFLGGDSLAVRPL